jgi:hypothetical protein
VLGHGLVAGMILSLLGCLFFVAAVVNWQGTGFARLEPGDVRIPLIGLVLVVSGAQLILLSFVLSLTSIGEDVAPVSSGLLSDLPSSDPRSSDSRSSDSRSSDSRPSGLARDQDKASR